MDAEDKVHRRVRLLPAASYTLSLGCPLSLALSVNETDNPRQWLVPKTETSPFFPSSNQMAERRGLPRQKVYRHV